METHKMPNNGFLAEYLDGFGKARGCALLGKTAFDKLEAVKLFLFGRNFIEFGKKGPEKQFVVIDCPKTVWDADSLTKIAEKYQDLPYVIFNNCEGILAQDAVLKGFAHLLDSDEYSPLFPTESFYIFLGGENTLPRMENYPTGSAESDHIASFCSFVQCHDFDRNGQFMGYTQSA